MLNNTLPTGGYLLFWDSAECSRSAVTAAYKSLGLEHLIPRFDAYYTLVKVVQDLTEQLGLKNDKTGTIHLSNLDKSVWGVNVARKRKGDDKNEFDFLLSVRLYSEPDVSPVDVRLAKTSMSSLEPQRVLIDGICSQLFAEHREKMPAKDLSRSIVSYVFEKKGVMLKNSGNLYFLDDTTRAEIEVLAAMLEKAGAGVQFTTATANLAVDGKLVARVNKALHDEIVVQTTTMTKEMEAFNSGAKLMRGNGAATRLKECIGWLEKIGHYEALFGKTLDDLRKAAEAAKIAVGVHGLSSLGGKKPPKSC